MEITGAFESRRRCTRSSRDTACGRDGGRRNLVPISPHCEMASTTRSLRSSAIVSKATFLRVQFPKPSTLVADSTQRKWAR